MRQIFISLAITFTLVGSTNTWATPASGPICVTKMEKATANLERVKAENKLKVAARIEEGKSGDPQIDEILAERGATKELYDTVESALQYQKKGKLLGFHGLVKHYPEAQKALLAMFDAMDNEKVALDLSYYIFARDKVGYLFLAKAKAAVERGVEIRIMMDSLGSIAINHKELKALIGIEGGILKDNDGNPILGEDGKPRRAKVTAVLFNPLMNISAAAKIHLARTQRLYLKLDKSIREKIAQLQADDDNLTCQKCDVKIADVSAWADVQLRFMRRSHDKLLIARGQNRVFSGGRNIAVPYFGVPTQDSNTFNDLTVEIRPDPNYPNENIIDHVSDYLDLLVYNMGNANLSKTFLGILLGTYKKQLGNMDAAVAEILHPEAKLSAVLAQMTAADEFNNMATETMPDGFSPAQITMVDQINNISRMHAWFHPEDAANIPNVESISTALDYLFFHRAKKSLKAISPYAVFGPKDIKKMAKFLRENPDAFIEIGSDSVYTADNMLVQAYLDEVVGPLIMALNDIPEFKGRVRYMQFGKLDGVEFKGQTLDDETLSGIDLKGHALDGNTLVGEEFYGKLHAKFYTSDDDMTLTTTFNDDNISKYKNSEVGFLIKGKQATKTVVNYHASFMQRSYLFGSPENLALRQLTLKMSKFKALQYNFWRFIFKSHGRFSQIVRANA